MDTSLRVVLLLVAACIVIGIIWDIFWFKRKDKDKTHKMNYMRKGLNPARKEQYVGTEQMNMRTAQSQDMPMKQMPQTRQMKQTTQATQMTMTQGNQSQQTTQTKEKRETKQLKQANFKKNPFAEPQLFGSLSEQNEFEDIILAHALEKSRNAGMSHEDTIHEDIIYENNTRTARQSSQEHLNIQENLNAHGNFKDTETKQNVAPITKLMALYVMARKPGILPGRKLFDAFREAYLFYGDMNIFHRHENTDGTGRIIFSVASATEPGIFEISKMETFITPGITLFAEVSTANAAITSFELMLRTAKQLAMRLDAEIKDEQHRHLTLPLIEKYREELRISIEPLPMEAMRREMMPVGSNQIGSDHWQNTTK